MVTRNTERQGIEDGLAGLLGNQMVTQSSTHPH